MSTHNTYKIGIDVGGTFTDLVAVDQRGRTAKAKVSSTPEDQSIGLVDGLGALAAELGLAPDQLLAHTRLIIHGTTAATNALLEGKGAKVGLLTTEGFRDVIEQREGYKPDRYNLRLRPPPALVPRHLRLPVRERMRFDGSIEQPLNEDSVLQAIEQLKRAGCSAVAVCLLHSYRNPAHERRVSELLAEQMPEAYVSLSSRVLPMIKEYERFSTTVVNAYVGPVLANYLGRLRSRVQAAGYEGEILIMHSHGGLGTIEASIGLAAGCVLSGPAGGVSGCIMASHLAGIPDLIAFDMGGTSSDIALIVDGKARISNDRDISGLKIALPTIDIHTIGSGGGSIARVNDGGILSVGPESAGAQPGPACYGRGGNRATTTDANVVLGYFDAASFMGGRVAFDRAAAEKAIAEIAGRMKCTREAAAEGVVRVINTQMAEGIRIVAVRAGRDPRNHALLSFGGAAGLHVADIARSLRIRTVLVPRSAAVFSAWGMLSTDLKYERIRTVAEDLSPGTVESLPPLISAMRQECIVEALASGLAPEQLAASITLDMRYGEQIFEIDVGIENDELTAPEATRILAERFHVRHAELYGYASRAQRIVVANVRLSVTTPSGIRPGIDIATAHEMRDADTRRIYLDGWTDVPVVDFESLSPGARVTGPCLLRSRTTSIILKQGDVGEIDALGWLRIEVGMPGAHRYAGGEAASRSIELVEANG